MKGKDLQKGVIDLARMKGWMVAHFHTVEAVRPNGTTQWITPVAADGKGFPDLVLLRDRVLVIEIKGDKDRLRPDQIKWLTAWRITGADVHVITPREWQDGTVEDLLSKRLPPVQRAAA